MVPASIGSAVVRLLIGETDDHVLVVDKLTYAGNLGIACAPLTDISAVTRFVRSGHLRHRQNAGSLCFRGYRPDVVMHLAAESHVDRSIDGPAAFIQTNIVGTHPRAARMTALAYWRSPAPSKPESRFQFPPCLN